MSYSFVIRYNYEGTVSGQAVGKVYVKALWPENLMYSGFSYTKDAKTATKFSSLEQAEAVARGKHWHHAEILEYEEKK